MGYGGRIAIVNTHNVLVNFAVPSMSSLTL